MSENDILRDYLITIGNYEPLTKERSVELATIYHNPQSTEEEKFEAREELFNHNARLVVYTAKQFKNHAFSMTMMDLIQEGNMGLLKAIDKYDPNKLNPENNQPYAFSTLASIWIKQAISKSLVDKGRLIRNPAHIVQKLTQFNRKIQELSTKFNRKPTDMELAEALNVDVNTISNYYKWLKNVSSLDVQVDDEVDGTLADLVVDDKPTPEMVAYDNNADEIIQNTLSKMDPRTEIIMRLRFGLRAPSRQECADLIAKKEWTIKDTDYSQQNTLDDVGSKVGLTRERVRQIIKKTLTDLKGNAVLKSLVKN